MRISNATLRTMRTTARLRWWQLSLRTLLLLVTLSGVTAFFHEPIAAWASSTWQRWFPEPAPPPPPVVQTFNCPGCGMG